MLNNFRFNVVLSYDDDDGDDEYECDDEDDDDNDNESGSGRTLFIHLLSRSAKGHFTVQEVGTMSEEAGFTLPLACINAFPPGGERGVALTTHTVYKDDEMGPRVGSFDVTVSVPEGCYPWPPEAVLTEDFDDFGGELRALFGQW
ncbi:hypothetical protein MFIFM68171_02194 [Madurella fahalii]|uniref:Uncharacterized protein n=1 Tax=Madurella fahalii TaxID=1157608 RepID=A0ABQ0G2R7_9PEZI